MICVEANRPITLCLVKELLSWPGMGCSRKHFGLWLTLLFALPATYYVAHMVL